MAIGRFRLGAIHTIRLPLGLVAIAGSWAISNVYFSDILWSDIAMQIDQERVGPIFETFVNGKVGALIPAALFFIVGVTLIAWPPNRQPLALNRDSEQAESKNDPQRVEQQA